LKNSSTYTSFDYPGALFTYASGINNAGQIVGFYEDLNGNEHAFLKNGSTYTTIDPPGANFAQAWGINNNGQVVGFYNKYSGGQQSFIEEGSAYSFFTVPGGQGTYAFGINDSGQLVGTYYFNGDSHGFLATPTPEPSTFILFGIGLAAIAVYEWRRRKQAAG